MGLDVKVLDRDNLEIDLKQNFDDDDDIGFKPSDDSFDEPNVETDDMDGYTVQDVEDEMESAADSDLDDIFGSDDSYEDEYSDDTDDME